MNNPTYPAHRSAGSASPQAHVTFLDGRDTIPRVREDVPPTPTAEVLERQRLDLDRLEGTLADFEQRLVRFGGYWNNAESKDPRPQPGQGDAIVVESTLDILRERTIRLERLVDRLQYCAARFEALV